MLEAAHPPGCLDMCHRWWMGLGPAVAREVVRLHGGTLRAAESSLGGALFEVRLPFAPPPG